MQLISISLVVATSSKALALPGIFGRAPPNSSIHCVSAVTPTNSPASSDSVAVTSAPSSTEGPSLTQQLLQAASTADRFKLLPNDTQFVFDFNQRQNGSGAGGELISANRKTFPALVGTGSGMVVGRIGPCGMNTFHVHPRSAELQIVVQGHLRTEMIPENGVFNNNGTRRVIKNEVGPFQMTPFYQGSIHVQFNPNCTDAIFVATFASEDFGTGQVLEEAFASSDDVVSASFGQIVAGEDIDTIRKAIPASVALGVEKCLEDCGIQRRIR